MHDTFNENDISHVVETDKAHIWHHLSQHKPYETTDPRIIIEGKGINVWDATGKEYIDSVSGGVWTVNVGYGRERIANAVRCVPPENKPIGAEMNACRPFLEAEISAMPNLRAILCLGLISHNNVLKTMGYRQSHAKFGHGAVIPLDNGVTIFDSYHCSRYNTNTGRLTEEMFCDVFSLVADHLS